MNHLELFSGTHSFGKVSTKYNNNVISLDRDLCGKCPFSDYDNSDFHIQEDIMSWNYKIFPPYYFDIITASPVCLWWSNLRCSWIGRKMKSHNGKVCTKELLEKDIDLFGKPMVDKVFEIIEYFKPKYWIIENPQGGLMKHYISEKYSEYNTYHDFSYCKFSNWGYQKNTRFWNNINGLENVLCKKDCKNIITIDKQKLHYNRMGTSKTIKHNGKIIRCNTKVLREKYKNYENLQFKKKDDDIYSQFGTNSIYERYRIPEKLIEEIFIKMVA